MVLLKETIIMQEFANTFFGFQQNRGIPGTNPVLQKNRKPTCENDIENYAHANLNRHKKGLFGKKISVANMLSWSKVISLMALRQKSCRISFIQ